MAIGDLEPVDLAGVSDVYYLDTGMFGTAEYTAVYLVDAERPAVVDTGNGSEQDLVLEALDRLGVAPTDLAVIAPTHVHLDHAGGTGHLAQACPNATVVTHEIGAPHLVDPSRLVEGTKRAVGDEWQYYAEPVPVPADRVTELADGDAIDLGDRTLEVHHAPGHAPHQAVYHDPDAAVTFCADAAGLYVRAHDAVRPLSPPPNFDLEQCLDDVERLRALDPAVLCYPHFGPVPTADRLDVYERVLVEWIEEVERLAARHGDAQAVVDALAEGDELAAVWSPRRARANVELNVSGALHYLERRGG